jgi:alanine racemase
VILTDFLETGRNERELYRSIAFSLQQHGVSQFIGIGPVICRNHAIFEAVPALETRFLQSVKEFQELFPRMTFANENILIKGARVFALEQIYRLFEKQTHQTLLEIDLDALVHNLRTYQQLLRPTTRLMAMVKAFSYGSGSYEIAAALEFNKVDYLAVAYADEGVELRKGGITLPIMVMNPDESAFSALINHNLEPEIYSLKLLAAFSRFLRQEGLTHFPIHVELETGMNRLGFDETDLEELCRMLDANTFRVQSVFSHLVASEDPDLDYFTRGQAEKFERMSSRLRERLPYSFLRHLLNTSGIVRHPGLQYDMVRTGIGLYGVDSTGTLDLRQVSTLRSAIAQIKDIQAGETVSYGRSGRAERNSRVATIRIGYADGYPRSLGNGRGSVLIGGRLLPTIGNINMDMTMVDITGVPDLDEGSPVVVFGKDLPVQQVASWAGTIPYEILTGLSQRVKRVYFRE